jgi:hypothetical protein
VKVKNVKVKDAKVENKVIVYRRLASVVTLDQ